VSEQGPVSASLTAELRELARQRGIVVWLDKEGSYTAFADALVAEGAAAPVPMRTFRGSYLETMLALEDLQDGVAMTPLVVHVPGHTEESIAETPLFELYRAGSRHRRSLATLVREAAHGRATPTAIDAFLAQPGLTLDGADAWLARQSDAAVAADGPDLSLHSAEALYDDVAGRGQLAQQLDRPEVVRAVWRRAEVLLGLADGDRRKLLEETDDELPGRASSTAEVADDVATALARWALAVEFVHDLKRAPTDAWLLPLQHLPKAVVATCQKLLQQRTLFEDVVRPMTQETGPTAYFVVDAMRFEMGVELFRELEGTAATTVLLKARLSELPSVTEVGMNVLAPVAHNGRLQPKFDATLKIAGFQAGEFRVTGPETRKRAMHDRVGGSTCPWLTLAEVQSRDSASLKLAVARASLVVVHSEEIDKAGEKGVGPTVFDTVMRQLRAAWRLLRDAGVKRFVFTSDHGFLLLDDNALAAQPHGRKIDPKRRHVFSSVAADHTGEVRVALSDLGYDGVSGHLMFPETTAPFDKGDRSMSFVHGGNSLQERVIPVLTVVHRAAAGGTTLEYRVSATQLDDVAGMYCVEVKVAVSAQHALDFGSPKELDLALRALDADDVQVELCQARGKARITGGAVRASVGERFELFFRLTGPNSTRVRLELHHPGAVAEVATCVLPDRFSVVGTRPPTKRPPPPETPSGETRLEASVSAARPQKVQLSPGWLDDFEGGVRQVFEHLLAHGTVTEQEAASMLGGPRQFRRFARDFDDLAKKAPFVVRIAEVAGVKRYVREGNG
jgi:hypothetical protein